MCNPIAEPLDCRQCCHPATLSHRVSIAYVSALWKYNARCVRYLTGTQSYRSKAPKGNRAKLVVTSGGCPKTNSLDDDDVNIIKKWLAANHKELTANPRPTSLTPGAWMDPFGISRILPLNRQGFTRDYRDSRPPNNVTEKLLKAWKDFQRSTFKENFHSFSLKET
jgi:hypothetical protein